MFKKRLKGLLAMVLAGSMTLTMLPMTALATITGDISIVEGGTLNPNDIINLEEGRYDIGSGAIANSYSDRLNSNNLWGVFYNFGPEDGSGYLNKTVTGDKLAETLYNLKASSETYRNVKIRSTHKVLVTTDNPATTELNVSDDDDVSVFPKSFNLPQDFDTSNPLKEAKYTVWYGQESDGAVSIGDAKKDATYPIQTGDASISVPMDVVKKLYEPTNSGSYYGGDVVGKGVTIIQLQNNYKTFEIPVYDGLGKLTTDKVSVTDGDTGDLIPDGKTEALNGSYVLVYDKDSSTQKVSAAFKNKADLWNAIKNVADTYDEFDVSKAKLVRYVNYGMYYDVIGYFTSVDLLNEVADNPDINYLNERKTSGSIWKISCCEISPTGLYTYPNKLVSGDSFDAEIKAFLNEHDCDAVDLSNKTKLLITATDPSTQVGQDGEIEFYGQVITINTDKQYPVKVSDLAAKLTAEIRPTAGMTYNKDEWELWPCYTASGRITIKSKATVDDPTADIGITHYELALEQKRDDLLVYFPKVDIAPTTPTTPTRPSTPSTPSTPSNTDNTQKPNGPVIDPETGKTGWDAIADRIGDAEDGDKIVIDMNSNTELPKNILDSIKGKEIDIVLDMGNGITWTINGKDVKNPQDIDLSVSDNTKIPVKVINKVTGECSYITISLNHNGSFGFKAVLTIELGKKNKGYYANLYYYNPKTKSTELTESDKINSNGEADFSFTHASDYIIIIDTVNHAKPVVKATSTANSARLSWNEVPEAEKYAVYKYRNGKAVKLIETEKRAVKINKLKSDTEYKYIVRAYINGKWTTMTKSDIVTVKTKAE